MASHDIFGKNFLIRLVEKMTRFLIKKLIFLSCVFSLVYSCREPISYPSIGTRLSNPISIASSSNGSVFYVLNADFNHNYDSGSILLLNENGDKLSTINVPRLGKILNIRDNNLLVAFDHESEESLSKTMLYDISNPTKPVKKHEWELNDCTPANIVSRSGYSYFALSCQEGHLYIGNFDNNSLKKIRTYPQVRQSNRRAMYLDPKRDLLFLFVTDTEVGNLIDGSDVDKETWVKGSKISDTPDEIPDAIQNTSDQMIDIQNNTSRFLFMMVDIRAEAAAQFPFKEYKDVRDTEARWLYFKLKNFDGSPDSATIQGDSTTKYYRTNFWEAQPDPEDPDSFYISHRGLGTINNSEQANDLIKVSFRAGGNPRGTVGNIPKLDSYMSFERVFGFKGDQTGKDKYFNSFKIASFSGRKVVILNSFRDLSNFNDPRYTIAAANLVSSSDPVEWFSLASSTDLSDSYWDLALGKDGNVLTVSFFDEKLKLFKVKYGETITLNKSIE